MGLIKKENQLIGQKTIELYIKGGCGLTILQAPSGKYHLYRFRLPNDRENFNEWCMFVFAKCEQGPWKYCGHLDKNMNFRHTPKSYFAEDSEEFKGAAYIVRMATHNIKTPMKLYHGGTCSVCGKELTDTKSLYQGMGYRCRKNLIKKLEEAGVPFIYEAINTKRPYIRRKFN